MQTADAEAVRFLEARCRWRQRANGLRDGGWRQRANGHTVPGNQMQMAPTTRASPSAEPRDHWLPERRLEPCALSLEPTPPSACVCVRAPWSPGLPAPLDQPLTMVRRRPSAPQLRTPSALWTINYKLWTMELWTMDYGLRRDKPETGPDGPVEGR